MCYVVQFGIEGCSPCCAPIGETCVEHPHLMSGLFGPHSSMGLPKPTDSNTRRNVFGAQVCLLRVTASTSAHSPVIACEPRRLGDENCGFSPAARRRSTIAASGLELLAVAGKKLQAWSARPTLR